MADEAATHYDMITDMWKHFMGDNLHFGYFESEDMELARATELMIDRMLDLCEINEDSRVLDVGCGIGGPAIYIHQKFKCAVDGISTSERGVELANQASKEKGFDKVRFKVADGMDNKFPSEIFDIVWIMETSHLIPDKNRLFRECYRVLKKGGKLVLCDLIQLKSIPFLKGMLQLLIHIKDIKVAPRVWGPAHIISLGSLCDPIIEAGFNRVCSYNVTRYAAPTLKWWSENAKRFRPSAKDEFSMQYTEDFIKGCANLEKAFRDGTVGYGMISAVKEA
jgi:27-O-demethylrifamycin SV methyltransferase